MPIPSRPQRGYERAAARALADAGLPVVVVNPRPVRHFAKALGILAKTDTLDAAVLARYGATLKPVPRAPRSDEEQAMADLMARRRQLFSMIVMEKNRLAAPVRALARRIEAHLRWLEREVKATDALLDTWIAADPERSAQLRILESVPGVGAVVAKTLITDLPELGRLGKRTLSALVGVAPFNRDSGSVRGKRHVRGGRASIRHDGLQEVDRLLDVTVGAQIVARYELPLLDRGRQHQPPGIARGSPGLSAAASAPGARYCL